MTGVRIEYRVTGEIDIPGEEPIIRHGAWKASKGTALEEREKVGSPLCRVGRIKFDRFFLETRTTTTTSTRQELKL